MSKFPVYYLLYLTATTSQLTIRCRLRVARTATAPPIFQAFVDYRLARGEKMTWGDCQLELLSFQTSKMAYDIAVDIIDNADGDCRFEFIVRDDIYTQEDVQQLADSYALLCEAFASQPHRTLGQAEIFEETQLKESLEMGRGQFIFVLQATVL
jgi:hybrid polyketide synthase/nonribosomal peptide synthetase ACE1